MYKHIVFDIDGTLVDNEKAVLYSLQEVLRKAVGRAYPIEELTFSLGITGEDALRRLNVENVSAVMGLWIKGLQQFEGMVSLHKGIVELLKELSVRGYKLGIATSRPRELLENDYKMLKVIQYFEIKICADDTVEHKPTAAPLLKYLELAEVSKDEVLYIGDSVHDSQCAENAGVDFALAVWGSHTEETPAKYYLRKPEDLLPVLKSDVHQS